MDLHESHDTPSAASSLAQAQTACCGASNAPLVSPFPVIDLGFGKVQMGDAIHDGKLPALWFGANGEGMGVERTLNRYAVDGETFAVVTFANVEGLDVLLDVVERIRREKFPAAPSREVAL